jgi:hypothetical protein
MQLSRSCATSSSSFSPACRSMLGASSQRR